MSNRGIVFVVSAPAGTGKTTLVERLKSEFPQVVQSIAYTSRSPREHEVNGVHYHFVTKEEFKERLKTGDFLEHVELYGTYYGTSRLWVEARLKENKMVFLVIDTQGALILQQHSLKFPIVYIFIKPPSIDALQARLLKRATETEESMRIRLAQAEQELSRESYYDYSIVNDQFEEAYQALKAIFIAEQHRIR